jgi:hypothetical protein
VLDALRCREIDWLAGKTGTPSFPADGLTLDELTKLCAGLDASPRGRPDPARAACGALRPYKWYVAAWKGDGRAGSPWTKAIAVLTERNWTVPGGRIHGSGDHGPNPAAEIALQVVARQVGLLAGGSP